MTGPDLSGALDVTVNGAGRRLPAGTTVGELVRLVAGDSAVRGIAVARNGSVVPRSAWAAVRLADGDRVEVLRATQGG